MKFIADLHIHSHFSIATSKQLIPENLDYWAKLKGIQVLGTGDCVHPGWLNELKEKLKPADNGLYVLKEEYKIKDFPREKEESFFPDVHFILSGEISSIYKKNGKVRKVHNICFFPDFNTLESFQARLKKIGNIESDGRPILGLDSKILLEMVLESSAKNSSKGRSFMIPAHIWTPWFSVLGSKSGFDNIEECFEDLTGEIFALETGLSSDPAMNWACSMLDSFKLVSNSDAHSPPKLGREANIFDTEISYKGLYNALKGDEGFLGTIEFFPQEGKYHYDGHRKCNVRWDPLETVKHSGICPECGKPVTLGVMYRVAELADRQELSKIGTQKDFYSITPLPEILAEITGKKNSMSKTVQNEYFKTIGNLGSEFEILLFKDLGIIREKCGELFALGIERLRKGEVFIEEGFDGEFGRIKVFRENEVTRKGNSLFDLAIKKGTEGSNKNEPYSSVKFDVLEFKKLLNKNPANKDIEGPLKEIPAKEQKELSKQDIQENKYRTQAIKYTKGHSLVIAGPGSGKTSLLIEKVIYLLNKKIATADEILILTFSNKACDEIRERIIQKFNKKIFSEKFNIFTFHSYGLSLLKRYFSLAGRQEKFDIIDSLDKEEILREILSGRSFRGGEKKSKKTKSLIRDIEKIKQASRLRSTQGIISESIIDPDQETIFHEYNNKLKKRSAFDLDDLIFCPVKIFNEDKKILREVQGKIKWLMVDEIQDINGCQYDLIKFLAGSETSRLFAIGDPDQAIYGFRGSDAKFVELLKDELTGIKTFEFNNSFRCPEKILLAASQVLEKGASPRGKPAQQKINIHEFDSDKSEADWIAAKIEQMIGGVRSFSIDSGMSDGEIDSTSGGLSDYAVLCRGSFMFEVFEEAFYNHGVPFQPVGTDSFFSGELFSTLVKKFKQEYYYQDIDGKKIEGVSGEIRDMIKAEKNLIEIFGLYAKTSKVSPEDQKRIEDFLIPFGNRYPDFLQGLSMRKGVDDLKSKVDAVSLITIHASKGLEFNTVFIPGCEKGILPFELFGKKDLIEIKEEERLFYVGITRTKDNLFLSFSKKRRYKGRTYEFPKSPMLARLEKDLWEFGKRKAKNRMVKPDSQLELFS